MAELTTVRTRYAVRNGLRKKGKGIFESLRIASTVDEDTIALAVAMAPEEVQKAYAEATVQVVGGPLADFLQMFLEFLESPLGQVLLDIIISLLLGA